MILIADSGSTKSDWVAISQNSTIRYSTVGINPYFHDEEFVFSAIKDNQSLYSISSQIEEVYFYGAGCSSEKLNSIVLRGLQKVFTQAEIHVDHDLSACALATYQGEPGISCIIGTGSNSCFYDGTNIFESIPALGYILGDEGSGAYFGKKLLADFLYNKLPENIHFSLQNDLGLDKEKIISNVYMKPGANVYLASFMPFIFSHFDDKYISNMILEGFKTFIDTHVRCYQDYTKYKVHFIGSIACLFQKELDQACQFYNVTLGQVIKKPIDGLADYHMKMELVKIENNERIN
jgi:N-acetylglucosamine kinase-like BadF-type ATPase